MQGISTESATAQSSGVTKTFDLTLIVQMLWSHWPVIVRGTVAGGVVLFLLSFLIRNTYQASTLVLPPDTQGYGMSSLAGASASAATGALAAFSLKNPTDLYVGIITSPGVENSVIRTFNLQSVYKRSKLSLARKEFESNAQIEGDAKSGLISISFIDHDPQRAADVANGIVKAFDSESSHMAISNAQRRRSFFDQQVAETKENLAKAEDALRVSKNQTGLVEPEGDARAMIGYESQLRAEVAAKTMELQSLRVYRSDESPEVQTTQRELQSLESQAKDLGSKTSDDAAFASRTTQTEASLQYMRTARDVKYNEALLELLLKNLELARLDEAREGNVLQVIDTATTPDSKYGPHRSFFLICGLLLGALISCAWVLLRTKALILPTFAARQ